MGYTPLGRLRLENGERRAFTAADIGPTTTTAPTTPTVPPPVPGRGMIPSALVPTILEETYGRGFIPPPATPVLPLDIIKKMEERIAPLIHPVEPIAPIPGPATVIEPFVRPPVVPAQVVPPTVYEPTFIVPDYRQLAFERVEAVKYGYSVETWFGMSATARARVRRLYAEEGPPATRDGTPIRAVDHTVVAGPDPMRQRYQEVGAGDHGGLEFREPRSYYPITRTATGLQFAEPAKVEPITKVPAADMFLPGELLKIGLLVAAGLFAYQQFFVQRRRRRPRRRYHFESYKQRLRMGHQ